MKTFNHFELEGNTYKLKVQKGFFYTITLGCVAAIIAILLYSNNKGNMLFIAFFAFVAILGILRTTAVLTFDNHNQQITRKRFYFSSPTYYNFDDFDHFLISKTKSSFITVGVQAIMVMRKGNKIKHLLLAQTLFTAKPLQKLTDEISTIMELPQN